MPPPAPAAVLLKTPAWFHEPNNDGIGFSALVERGHAAVAYTAILRRRLTAKLRYDLGIAYSPKAELTPRGAGVAELTAAAGALPQSRQTLVDSFARELDKLGIEPVSAAELRSAAEEFSTAAQTATAEAAFVVGCALDQVLGRTPPPSVAAMIERMSAVTPDAVQAIAIQALDSGLYALPAAADLQRPHVVRAVSQSPCELSGMKFRSRDYPWDKSWLVMAAEGVAVADGAQQVTVRYADCAALLAWPDGGRTIIGRDGLAIRIEPTLWRMSDSVAGKVDHAVLPELRIAMPARAVDKVPEPATGHVRRAVGWLLRSPRAARLLGAAAGLAAAIGVIADIPHASSLGFLTLPAAALGAQGAMIARRRLILRARPRLTR